MLIATRFADTAQVHQVASPAATARQLTFFPDRVTRRLVSSRRDGDYFVFTKDTGGNEFFQLYRYDLADGDVTLLTDGSVAERPGRVVARRRPHRLQLDAPQRRRPRHLRDEPAPIPRATGCCCEVEGGGWAVADWSPDDKQLLVAEYVSINESYLWLVDAATGAEDAAHAQGRAREGRLRRRSLQPGRQGHLRHHRQRQRVPAAGLHRPGHRQAHVPRERHPLGRRRRSSCRPTASTIAFVTNEDGISRAAPARHGHRQGAAGRPELPTGVIGGARTGTRTARDLGFTRHLGPLARRRLFARRRQRQGRALDRERDRRPERRPSFAEPELVQLEELRRPRDLRLPLPAAGALHRQAAGDRSTSTAAPRASRAPTSWAATTTSSNELGVALIYPNVRGSTGYGKTFLKLDNGLQREDSVQGHRRAARLDRARATTSTPTRVMVTGGSYGGYMTLAVGHALQRPHPLLARRGGHLELRHVPGAHRELPPRPAPRRVRRRARSRRCAAFLEKIAPLNHAGEITQAAVRRAGQERSARAAAASRSRWSTRVRKNEHARSGT